MKIEDDGKIQSRLTEVDVTDIARPFLVWPICHEVMIQQFGAMLKVCSLSVPRRGDDPRIIS